MKYNLFFKFINNNFNKNFLLDQKTININYLSNKILSYSVEDIKKKILKKKWKMNNTLFIIIDLRKLKTNIVFFNKIKSISFINNGLIFKKLQLKNKKYKKSEKLSFLALKSILNRMSFAIKNKNIIIQIKGIKKNKNTLLKYIVFFLNNKNNNYVFIDNPKISNNKFFKFKKIKSIKRRLKKKLLS